MNQPKQAKPEIVDVSHWQGLIDWRAVAAAGIKAAYCKCTNGAFQTDDTFARNVRGAQSAKLPAGAYHFMLSDQAPEAQAQNLLDSMTVGGIKTDLIPALDCEWDIRRKGEGDRWASVPLDARVAMIGRFCQVIKDALGVQPVIYTSTSWWQPMIVAQVSYKGLKFGDSPLWLARYGTTPGNLPAPWKSFAIWQYNGAGTLPGIKGTADRDLLNVPLETLLLPKR